MRIYKLLSVALMATFLSSCTASLIVKDKKDRDERGNDVVPGVPFRVPTVYIFSGVLTKHSQGVECDIETPFYETHVLPGSELYYANVKTGGLAKSEFAIELTDQGTLKKISLNSDTTVDDVASGVASLLDKAGPLLVPPPTPSEITKSAKPPSCDTGKVVHCVETFKDFMDRKKIDASGAKAQKCSSEQLD